jgi:CRP-like cAMP-binding protein
MVYFIESGQIKLLMLSPEGKQCLLAIHSAGDIFGELCLFGLGARLETATAMEETNLKKIPRSQFLARLSRDSLLEGFVKYLAVGDASKRSTIIMIKKPKSRFTSRNGEGLSAGRQPNF